METLGELVARLREDRGLTQSALADRAGVDPVTIARVEQGRGPGWWRKTARAVFRALASHKPLSEPEAALYFRLSKFNPREDERQQAVAEGLIGSAASSLPPPPVADDLQDMLGKMVYSFGEHRTRALMRTMLTLAIGSEPSSSAHAVPPPPGSIAIESDSPFPHKQYVSTARKPDEHGLPLPKSRRRKSG